MSWKCRLGFHDWERVGAAREDVCVVIAGGKKPGVFHQHYFGVITVMEGLPEEGNDRPSAEWSGLRWFQDRVCLRCGRRDNGIQREVRRIRDELREQERRQKEMQKTVSENGVRE